MMQAFVCWKFFMCLKGSLSVWLTRLILKSLLVFGLLWKYSLLFFFSWIDIFNSEGFPLVLFSVFSEVFIQVPNFFFFISLCCWSRASCILPGCLRNAAVISFLHLIGFLRIESISGALRCSLWFMFPPHSSVLCWWLVCVCLSVLTPWRTFCRKGCLCVGGDVSQVGYLGLVPKTTTARLRAFSPSHWCLHGCEWAPSPSRLQPEGTVWPCGGGSECPEVSSASTV